MGGSPATPGSRSLLMFEIAGDRPRSIGLQTDWAKPYREVEIRWHDSDPLGRVALVSLEGDRILSLPWHDNVDQLLRGESYMEALPIRLPTGAWSDLDQGWWASIVCDGGFVYIADTDFDDVCNAPADSAPAPSSPGHVDFGGVEIRWNSVPKPAYFAAWDEARAKAITRGTS